MPGVLALAVMSSAMVSLGIATGYERRYGVLKRLGSTPSSRAGLLTAKTLNVLGLELLQAVLIVLTGIALGWDPTGGLPAAVLLLLVGTVAFAGIGMLLAGTLRAEANLAVANGLFLVLLFLGGMAYPLAKLPDALQTFSKALPAATLSETVRAVLDPGPRSPPASWSCSWCGRSRHPSPPPVGSAGRSRERTAPSAAVEELSAANTTRTCCSRVASARAHGVECGPCCRTCVSPMRDDHRNVGRHDRAGR